ncbi:MAG: ABC transporter substrate-binding protein [Phycisphaerales bacterium]|jgi:NitT/TauT family transport system substrate-binding protein|nr:ABC transporter substrate-binding protein [Phycisphaerales bacterium]
MKTKTNIKILAACLAISLVVCGCQSGPSDDQANCPTLTVGHVGHDHQIALYIAALEGEKLAEKYGVSLKEVKAREVYDLIENGKTVARLKLVKVGGGSKMPAAMGRGELDIGLGGVAAVAKFADGGQPFKIIAPLQTDGDMLVMKTDSPITDWASFVTAVKTEGAKPLKIGYKAPVAVAKLIFERAMKFEGISYGYEGSAGEQVTLVNMRGGKNAIPLLSQGSIDGFVMNQPAVAICVHKKLGKVVAQLRDLPPAGKWTDHPCCCVCATQKTLDEHPDATKAFLKLIHAGTQLIAADSKLAVDRASEWTKVAREIEADSIPSIRYVSTPNEEWITGMEIWAKMMQDIKAFTGKYAEMTPKDIIAELCDMSLCEAAAKELTAQ